MSEIKDSVEQGTPSVLEPLPGGLNLLETDAAGCCGGGACSFPAPKTQ
jgi:hypothetical protein